MAELSARAHKLDELGDRRRRFIEDPRTFFVAISRQQWRDMPFGAVIDTAADGGTAVYVDGPVMVFSELRQRRALELKKFLDRAIDDYRRVLAKLVTGDEDARKKIGGLQHHVRRCHIALVNLAIGYTWPRNPPGHIEFAEDASA